MATLRFLIPVLCGGLLLGSCSSDDSGGGDGGTAGSAGSAGSGASGGTGGTGGSGATGGTQADAAGGTGGTAGAAGSSGSAGAGGSAGALSCLLGLTDDFADGTIGAQWDSAVDTGMQLTETGGELEVGYPASPTGVAYAALSSKAPFDLTGCGVLVRVNKTPNAATEAYMHLYLDDGGNALEIILAAGTLYAFQWLANSDAADPAIEMASVAFDPAKHAWWRISESGGTLHWETSGDGKVWASLATASATFSVQTLTVWVGGGVFQAESAAPGTASFDDLNLPPQ